MPKSIQSVLVVGSGAVGSYIAARMYEKGIRVTILARPERAAHFALRGVHIESLHGRFRRPIPTLTSAEISSKFDLVIAGCRSHLLADGLDAAAAAMFAGTPILSLADGGPHMTFLRRRYTLRPVLEGLFEARLLVDADGVVRHRPPAARIRLRHNVHDGALLTQIADLMSGRGLDAIVTGDFDTHAWTRAIFQAAAVGAMLYTRRPLRDTLRLNSGVGHFQILMREGAEIAKRSGVSIPPSAISKYAQALTFEGEPVASPPSVCTAGGGGAEAHYLLGQMVERAERCGCRVPSLQFALRMADRCAEPTMAM